jgi:hypothetical protein
MGFYDCRCMITGVSLKGVDAVLVPLQQLGTSFLPICFAIKGNYNRLGSIDGIEEDANTNLVLDYFLDKFQAGEFVIDLDYLSYPDYYPILTVENLLNCFERNLNDGPEMATLNGREILFALICRPVWDALVQLEPFLRQSFGDVFRQQFFAEVFGHLFADIEVTEAIYGGRVDSISSHLCELSAVSNFLVSQGVAWKPSPSSGQDYSDDMREYLEEAKRTFGNSTVILNALKEYELEVSDLLQDY